MPSPGSSNGLRIDPGGDSTIEAIEGSAPGNAENSCRHLTFSSSMRLANVVCHCCFSRSKLALAPFSDLSKSRARSSTLFACACRSLSSCSRIAAVLLISSSCSLTRLDLIPDSRSFLLESDSARAVSSRSFSTAVSLACRELSMPCQFSLASEY